MAQCVQWVPVIIDYIKKVKSSEGVQPPAKALHGLHYCVLEPISESGG